MKIYYLLLTPIKSDIVSMPKKIMLYSHMHVKISTPSGDISITISNKLIIPILKLVLLENKDFHALSPSIRIY
jgi:hypothetical protein